MARPMARNLLLALAVIACMVGTLVWITTRTTPSSPSTESNAGDDADAGRPLRRGPSMEELQQASASLMPEGYGGVQLGMSLEDLHRVRHAIRRDAPNGAPRTDGREVWVEDDPSGAQVIYLIDLATRRLAQIQFASVIHTGDELRTHFEAMENRYGHPTGLWDCPGGSESAPLRRFTFRREIASVEEAVLIYQGNIALTLIVASNDDIAQALSRSHCTPVHDPDAMTNFPVARSLPGPTTPLLRAIPRDP
jgi:hypothetical protein